MSIHFLYDNYKVIDNQKYDLLEIQNYDNIPINSLGEIGKKRPDNLS